VALYMSGGLDSSAVAAAARKLTPAGHALDLRAYTTVYDELIPDVERYYSGLVGRALDIPIAYQVADGYRLYERQDQEELYTPEPLQNPLSMVTADFYPRIASHARVVLSGDGGDPAFLGSSVYALNLLKSGRLGRLAVDMWRCLARGRLPKVGFRARLRRWLGKPWASPYPNWLNVDFEAKFELRARWQQVNAPVPHMHPRRPEAYESLTHSYWPYMVFEYSEPGVTRYPFEVRYPFFDVRLLTFVLAIPALPWCDQKELLRCALSGLVPDTIRLRPKTPLQGDPIRARLCREDYSWLDRFESGPDLERFVDRQRLPRIAGETDSDRFLLNTRPYDLNNWLRLKTRSSLPPKSRSRVDPRAERPSAVARF
jgi:asparagine synthase (glutamine-hydrolysing)